MNQYRILIFKTRTVIRLISIVMVSSLITILISACTIVDDSQATVNEYTIDKSYIAEEAVSEWFGIQVLRDFAGWEESITKTEQNDYFQIDLYHFGLNKPLSGIYQTKIIIDITYPRISYGDSGISIKANELLDKLLFDMGGGDYGMERLSCFKHLIMNDEAKYYDGPGYSLAIECEVSHLSDRYVSFAFRVTLYNGGASSATTTRFLTIDFTTGKEASFVDICNQDSVSELLSAGQFQIQEGMYSPAGWMPDDIEVRNSVAESVKNGLDAEHQLYRSRENMFNPKDFVFVSETDILLKVSYVDSLYGYVILSIQLP